MTVRFLSSSKSGSMSSHEGKAGETSHIEEIGTTQKPGFGTRLKAHYRRFWWLHLIVFVSATLIIVLCLIYVAFPRISQDGITSSTLEIQSLILSNPTPNSFHLEQTALIGNENTYHPRLESFNASLSLHDPASDSDKGEGKDVPYAYITLPAIHATKTATSYVNQTVQITDLDAFNAYNAAVLGGEEVKVRVKGRTDLHLMRFPTTAVDYDKVVTMKGLNKLTGFNVTDFTIQLVADEDGTNMVGTVYIPNPTVMTLSMGNVTFNNYIHGTHTLLGNTTLTNLILRPGDNNIPMRSIIDQDLVIRSLLSDFKDGFLPVDIVVSTVVYGGERIGYFEKALKEVVLGVRLDVGGKLGGLGVDLGGGGGGG